MLQCLNKLFLRSCVYYSISQVSFMFDKHQSTYVCKVIHEPFQLDQFHFGLQFFLRNLWLCFCYSWYHRLCIILLLIFILYRRFKCDTFTLLLCLLLLQLGGFTTLLKYLLNLIEMLVNFHLEYFLTFSPDFMFFFFIVWGCGLSFVILIIVVYIIAIYWVIYENHFIWALCVLNKFHPFILSINWSGSLVI